MNASRIKFLTLFTIALATSINTFADYFSQEKFKTHLRWNFVVNKEQVIISKSLKTVKLETLDIDLHESLIKEISAMSLNNDYFLKITHSKDNFPAKPAAVEIQLKDESVELFSFYKDSDKKYILDFWINNDLISAKSAAVQKPVDDKLIEAKAAPLLNPDNNDTGIKRPAKLPPVAQALEKKSESLGPTIAKVKNEANINPYRDFRYGASLVWDYSPLIPNLDKLVNLSVKTPDYFYPIKDREYEKDDKEAHMQLTINLYNKEKWGLMNKSINLYSTKYGTDKNFETNEFLKANALIKNNFKEKNKSVQGTAINILKTLFERTSDYELKSALAKYLIHTYLDMNENVQTLNLSKKLYVDSKAAFDIETAEFAANVILHTLAKLGQIDQIEQFVSDPSVKKKLPPQLVMAYKSYSYLSLGKTDELIKEYEKIEKSLVNPKHPAILYNTAESYFRNAQYEKAIRNYDEFLRDYSYIDVASNARLRIAVAFDIQNRSTDEVLNLYKNAINRSVTPAIRYEAKIRYVSLRVDRKRKLNDGDLETIVFLEATPDEKKEVHGELKTLLWLVRLRTFINTKFYQEALTYLASIPLETMKPTEKRVFEADGAEIIYGLINEYYVKEEYAKAIKLWETYREKYIDKVSLNPYINFIACHSYLKLGLVTSYDRALEGFKKLKGSELHTYPIWVERTQSSSVVNLLSELSILNYISNNEWKLADQKLEEIIANGEKGAKISYYRGLIAFQKKKYRESADNFERLLVNEEGGKFLNPAEISTVTTEYLESLYNLKENEKFKSVAKALLSDLSISTSPLIEQSMERVNYLLIESLTGEAKPDYIELEQLITAFNSKFKKSSYKGRIYYLQGMTFIKNNKYAEGEKILKEIIKDQNVPGYIKELSKTELSALELKRRNL